MSESYSKGKILNKNELLKGTTKKSTLFRYVTKELIILFRTPIFFINCILPSFIWPIFFLIPVLFQPNALNDLGKLSQYLQNPSSHGLVVAGVVAISLFITATNGITATSISREGQNFFVTKYLPIDYKTQIWAKILSGAIIGTVGTIVLLVSASIFFKPSIILILLSCIAGILGIFISCFIGMIIDLYSPKLVWDNEQKAIKQNLNVVFSMLLSSMIAGLTVLAVIYFTLNLWKTFFGVFIIYGIANFILYKFLITKGVKLFENIEV